MSVEELNVANRAASPGDHESRDLSDSFRIGEPSFCINKKPKTVLASINTATTAGALRHEIGDNNYGWLRRPETRFEDHTVSKKSDVKNASASMEVRTNSSMRDFLEKEKMCKTLKMDRVKDKDDTLCDISTVFGKYSSEFENATDEDIGSIMEEMGALAAALSPNSAAPEQNKSTESIEELLHEAEKLVGKNVDNMFDIDDNDDGGLTTSRLGNDIFKLIEQEVHRETEKIKKTSKPDDKLHPPSPDSGLLGKKKFNCSKVTPKRLDPQRRRFEQPRIEISSSSSDLEDPIERHSQSEDLKKSKILSDMELSIRKEIIDVDKYFFDNALRKSKERAECKISQSSSLEQEDFSELLKILSNQSDNDKRDANPGNLNAELNTDMHTTDDLINKLPNDNLKSTFPEKEISEILEREMVNVQDTNFPNELGMVLWTNNDNNNDEKLRKSVSDVFINKNADDAVEQSEKLDKSRKNYQMQQNAEKINTNASSELYTIGLTPRLELFADAIPKLIAEKTGDNTNKNINDTINIADNFSNNNNNISDIDKNISVPPDNKRKVSANPSTIIKKNNQMKKQKSPPKSPKLTASKLSLGYPSRSYDQLPKSTVAFRSSLTDIRNAKAPETLKKSTSAKLSKAVKPKICEQKNLLSSNIISSRVKFSIKPTASTSSPNTIQKQFTTVLKPSKPLKGRSSESIVKQILNAGGNSRRQLLTKDEWEILCNEEKHKNVLLKNQIEAESKMYKQQIDSMRISFEEELFVLKKQNIILKSKIDQMSLDRDVNRRGESAISQELSSTRVTLLEKELEKQENLMRTYETENKRLMDDMKNLQLDLKRERSKPKNTIKDPSSADAQHEIHKLNDTIKDLKEEILKLNYQLTDLRQKHSNITANNDDMMQQNGLIQEELNMFKEQLKAKDKFITDKLHAMSREDMEARKNMEDMKIELKSKTEKLRITKEEFDKFQMAVVPIEQELLELRVKEKTLQEKIVVSRSHVEREKVLTQKLKDQVILDNKKILDLNRQVREMERIIKRKNPDFVSGLLVQSGQSSGDRMNIEKIKHLEERIASLEGELTAKQQIGSEQYNELQLKYNETKKRYNDEISELEKKLSASLSKCILRDFSTQTDERIPVKKCRCMTDNKRLEKNSSVDRDDDKKDIRRDNKSGLNNKLQNGKEDAHLIATIRGLKLELVNKDKTIAKMSRELQELQKNNRRLFKEREKILCDKKNSKITEVTNDKGKIYVNKNNIDNIDPNLNIYQNGHISTNNISKHSSGSSKSLYDPLQYSENGENSMVKRLSDENEILKEELSKMNKDFMTLKNKRLHDLNLLQEEHEREVASLVKEYSIKFGDSKVVKLQGQLNTQMALITHLKQQVETLRDYKEQVLVLKVEREHLENRMKILNEKVKYLSTPGTEQLQLLQDKITLLQQRHESREITLQNLVRDLLRNKNHCKDCYNSRGGDDGREKNRQLCYYKQELDHILGMLQEIANVS